MGIEGFTKVIKVENSFYDEDLTALKEKINVISETPKETMIGITEKTDIIKC